jgi:hypothetical protein
MTTANSQPHWLARSIGSAVFTPAILIVAVAVSLISLSRTPTRIDSTMQLVVLVTLVLIAVGCAALAWIRPQRVGLSPPHVMLSLGFGGMLLGLLYDVSQAGPERMNNLCAQSSYASFFESLQLHLAFLPGMHAGMLAGGLLAIPSLRILRPHCGRYLCSLFAQNLMCSGWMLMGMALGAIWLSRWPVVPDTYALPGMLGGMFIGMTWGMVISVALYRTFFLWQRGNHRVSNVTTKETSNG